MIRDPDTDGLALRVLQQARNLGGGTQDEGVRSWGVRLQQTVGDIVDARVGGYFGEVAAHQGVIVLVVYLTQARNAFHAGLVADCTTECVSRVGRVDDETAAAHTIGDLADQPWLRIHRMYDKDLGHRQRCQHRWQAACPMGSGQTFRTKLATITDSFRFPARP